MVLLLHSPMFLNVLVNAAQEVLGLLRDDLVVRGVGEADGPPEERVHLGDDRVELGRQLPEWHGQVIVHVIVHVIVQDQDF